MKRRKGRFGAALAVALLLALIPGVAGSHPWIDSYTLETQQRYTEALAALEPVLAQRPVNEFAVMRSGWLLYLAGKYNESLSAYQRALELNPRSLDARLGLTLPLLAQKRWREAAMHAQQVLETAPWNYYAHVRLMVSQEGQGQWEALARHAADVAARYPTDATLYVYLGRAEAKLGNVEKAKAAYRAVLERVPGHYEASDFLATH